jgi:hypothetical protein
VGGKRFEGRGWRWEAHGQQQKVQVEVKVEKV